MSAIITAPVDDSFVAGTDAYARRLRAMQGCVRTLLKGVGEDPDREGLRDTPKVRTALDWSDGLRQPAPLWAYGSRLLLPLGRAREQSTH
jgi:hypothetical protein